MGVGTFDLLLFGIANYYFLRVQKLVAVLQLDRHRAAALFDGQPSEPFEAAWSDNEHYAWVWPDVSSEAALFDGGASTVESFSGVWDPATTI